MKVDKFKMTPKESYTEEIIMRKEFKIIYSNDIYTIIIEKTNCNIILRSIYYESKLNLEIYLY